MPTDLLGRSARSPVDRTATAPTVGGARRDLGVLAVLLPFLLVGAVRATAFAEGDTFWATVTGGDVLRLHTIFLPDRFSWTIPDQVWHPNSWLYDVALHLSDVHVGPTGLGIAALVGVLVTGLGVAVAGGTLRAGPGALVVVAFLTVPVLVPWLSARPQTVSYGLLPVTVVLAARLLEWTGRRLAAGAVGLCLLSALWVNVHLAALSAVIATAAGLGLVLLVHRRSWRLLLPRALLAGAATVLGCTCSPLGWSVLASALTTRDASTAMIDEWAPLWRAPAIGWATWSAAALGLVLTLLAWRRRPQDPLLAVWSGATGVLVVLGVSAARFSPMAAVLALPAAALWISGTDWQAARWRRTAALLASGVATAAGVVLLVLAITRLPHLGEPSNGIASRDTVEAIPAGSRVLNEYDDGGWITYLRVDDGVLVAQDGRNDAYGTTVLDQVQGLIDGRAGALGYLRDHGVSCLLLSPDRPIVAQAEAAGWQVAASDADRVLVLAPVG